MARPICSVILTARNEAESLDDCFRSLSQQRTAFPFEILYVDQSSTDGSYRLASRFAKQQKNLSIFRLRTPGHSPALNFGASKARGQILLFTEPSCLHSRNWIQEMVAPLLRDEHYPLVAVGGRNLSRFSKSEKPSPVENYLDKLASYWERDRLSAFPDFLPWAPASNLAVKREVFFALGGFDKNWKNAAYDVDFCWRLSLCGFVLGYAHKAETHQSQRSNIFGLMRRAATYALYNKSLLATYQSLLSIPKLPLRHHRKRDLGARLLRLVQHHTDPRQLRFRSFDLLSLISEFTGEMQSRILGVKPNSDLEASRAGHTPGALEKKLPRGYAHLHQEGWCYWKFPQNTDEEGDLILFRPRRDERFRLNPSAWKIWEVKSDRGQTEDAAEALGQSPEDAEVLRDIDELTLDFRSRRLLP